MRLRIEFNNAQNTPHLSFMAEETIIAQLSLCADGLSATGNLGVLESCFPKTDGIVLFDGIVLCHKVIEEEVKKRC